GDLAGGGSEFGGVAQKVPENLPQPRRVATYESLICMQAHDQPQLLRIDFAAAGLYGILDQSVQIDRFGLKVELSLGDARHIEQIVDEPRFNLDVSTDQTRIFADVRRRSWIGFQRCRDRKSTRLNSSHDQI